jgi:beta-phosphoglucomutase-like phosphatase (HAD superfamily)
MVCNNLMKPMPTAVPSCVRLPERSAPVVSCQTPPRLRVGIRAAAIAPAFQDAHVELYGAVAKPERAIYIAAAEALDVEPAGLLFIEDGSNDQLAGAARAALLQR